MVPENVAETGSPKRPLKVGLIVPQWTGSLGGDTPRWKDAVAVARRAEEVGFDSLWLADDLLVRFREGEPLGMWECWSFLSALAAATSRVELGTLVVCNNFRNPALLAKMADTVDEISGGRLILGLGAGGDSGEHRAFGFRWEHRFERFEEALAVIRGLLREGQADFEGKYYRVRGCALRPRGPRKNGPPVLIGTVTPGPRMLRLTVQYADLWNGWLAFGRSSSEEIPPLRAALDHACEKIGRDPTTLGRTVAIGVALLGHRLAFGPSDITSGALTGSPEELAAAFRGFARQGISHVQVYLAPNTLAGIEAFAPVLELLDRERTSVRSSANVEAMDE